MNIHTPAALAFSLVAVLAADAAVFSTSLTAEKPPAATPQGLKSPLGTSALGLGVSSGTLYVGSTSVEKQASGQPTLEPATRAGERVDPALLRFDQKLEAITEIKAAGGIQRAAPSPAHPQKPEPQSSSIR